jgi:hypothetical protein
VPIFAFRGRRRWEKTHLELNILLIGDFLSCSPDSFFEYHRFFVRCIFRNKAAYFGSIDIVLGCSGPNTFSRMIKARLSLA